MKRVLIVDDNRQNALLAEVALKMATYDVAVTVEFDGPTALHRMKSQEFDLVVLDMHMPGMDGLAVLVAMRQNPATKQLPVIVLTSDDKCDSRAPFKDLGVAEWLFKPYRPAQLPAAVASVLQVSAAPPVSMSVAVALA